MDVAIQMLLYKLKMKTITCEQRHGDSDGGEQVFSYGMNFSAISSLSLLIIM